MAKKMNSLLSVVVLASVFFGGVLSQPKPDDASCLTANNKKPKECCKAPMPVDEATMTRCATENPKIPPTPGAPKTEGCCLAQCVTTTVNIFKNNAIDAEAAKTALAATTGSDPAFAPLIGPIVDECASKVNADQALKATPVSAVPGKTPCSFIPEAFIGCVELQLLQKCPAASWNDNADCQSLRQKAASGCSFSSLMK
ncbi:general odorant-binding protein 67-like [Uranotaenia lowii]|uniref:general odorant-binding protein 67-like n=1 Tax=Uranotaenia lowii TaxID=190385 RepID=UPI002479C3BB|nr:general odorant-binding protein 67-like [Uranotaenia lowii]